MMDWRVTPNRVASLSSEWIIQAGKSTLTRIVVAFTRLARDRSRYLEMSFPASKSLSSSLAFIEFILLNPRPPHGDDPRPPSPFRDDRGPDLVPDLPDQHRPGLVPSLQRDLEKLRIVPKSLRFDEIDAVLGLI